MNILIAVLVLSAAEPPTGGRKWTDSTGKFSVDAKLVEVADNTVSPAKQDGTTAKVPLAQLSRPDRLYVNELIRLKRMEALVESTNQLPFIIETADTSAMCRVLIDEHVSKLCKQCNGKQLTIRYQIQDIEGYSSDPSIGTYSLQLRPIVTVRSLLMCYYISRHRVNLSQKEMLAVKKNNTLVVNGTARIEHTASQWPGSVIRMDLGHELGSLHIYFEKQNLRIADRSERLDLPDIALDSDLP